MNEDTLRALRKLADASRQLNELIDRDEIVLVRFGDHKVAMICGQCDGVFTTYQGGIRCRNCGQTIIVRWTDGVAPDAAVLRLYLLNHGADLFGLDLPDAA